MKWGWGSPAARAACVLGRLVVVLLVVVGCGKSEHKAEDSAPPVAQITDVDGKRTIVAKKDGVSPGGTNVVNVTFKRFPAGEKIYLTIEKTTGTSGSATFDTATTPDGVTFLDEDKTAEVDSEGPADFTKTFTMRGGDRSDEPWNVEMIARRGSTSGAECGTREPFTCFWFDLSASMASGTVPDDAKNQVGDGTKLVDIVKGIRITLPKDEVGWCRDADEYTCSVALYLAVAKVVPPGLDTSDFSALPTAFDFHRQITKIWYREKDDGTVEVKQRKWDQIDSIFPDGKDRTLGKGQGDDLYLYHLDIPNLVWVNVDDGLPSGYRTTRRRSNFYQWVTYEGVVCSDDWYWCERQAWSRADNGNIVPVGEADDNQVKTGQVTSLAYDLAAPAAFKEFSFLCDPDPLYEGVSFRIIVVAMDTNDNIKVDWSGDITLSVEQGTEYDPSGPAGVQIEQGKQATLPARGGCRRFYIKAHTAETIILKASSGGYSQDLPSREINPNP